MRLAAVSTRVISSTALQMFDDKPIPPPVVPVYKGPPCATCRVPMTVDFQLANCVNVHCGKVKPCQCTNAGKAPVPYTTKIENYTWAGYVSRAATFCATCGDEVTL